MTSEMRRRLQDRAAWIQRFGVALSALLGGGVGLSFALGAGMAWSFALGGFLSLLWVGMAVVVLSAISGRVPSGAWRDGLKLNCKIFLVQTTMYGLMVLGLALTPIEVVSTPITQLALAMFPGLYLCSVLAIVGSGPLYLAWLPVRDR